MANITKQTITAARAQTEATIVTVEEARKAATAIEALVASYDPTHYYYGTRVQMLTTAAGAAGIIWLAHFETKDNWHLIDLPIVIDDAGKASTCVGTVFLEGELHPESATQEGGEA